MSKKASRFHANIDLACRRHDLMASSHTGRVALRHVITGEVRVVAAGSAEAQVLRRERDALNGYRPLWAQTRLPKR